MAMINFTNTNVITAKRVHWMTYLVSS